MNSERPPDVVSPDTRRSDRVPPGQVLTRKWPVLHAGTVPTIDPSAWRFRLSGLIDRPREWTWEEFRALPSVTVLADMHCVTTWSRLDNLWEGVRVSDLLKDAGVRPEARFAVAHAAQGWTTNLPLADLSAEDCLLAWSHDGQPLSPDHGGPLRLVVPRLYAWKSAKWVRGLELLAEDRPGFWERGGYHDRGDPWTEQRYSD